MKKINNFFRKVAKSFDRRIVVPLTRVVLKITSFFDKSSTRLENILARPTTLLFLSLFLALAIFIGIDQKILLLTSSRAEVFKDQKVDVLYNEERFVLTGIPESADITLIGSQADLYIARQTSSRKITIDLTHIREPGTYKVDLKYDSGLSSVEHSVNPSQVTVVVYEKKSKNHTLTYKVVNADKLDNTYEVNNVELSIDRVVISGADFEIDKVASVDALIDVNKLTSISVGNQILEDIILRAYDREGNVVDVDINYTTKPTAKVQITSSSRTVPLNFVPENSVPFGKAISSYSFSQNTVVVYGNQSVLDELERTGIDIKIDVSRLTSDFKGSIDIPVPSGVRQLSINKVDAEIKITDSGTPVTLQVKIDALNTPTGFDRAPATEDDAEVLVDINGASAIIQNLRASDIQVYVDLSGFTKEGTYTVPIQIRPTTTNARLATFVPKKATVRITLTKN